MVEATTHSRRAVWITAATLAAVMALGGCAAKEKRVNFNGNHYPTREKGVDKQDRNQFAVTVRRTAQGLDGAREAGRHGGSKYCLKHFGTSEIEWARGPDDPPENLQLSNGNLILSGRCVSW